MQKKNANVVLRNLRRENFVLILVKICGRNWLLKLGAGHLNTRMTKYRSKYGLKRYQKLHF